jgi:hypothetical protein
VMGKGMSSEDGSSAVDAPAPLSMSVPAAAIANKGLHDESLCARCFFARCTYAYLGAYTPMSIGIAQAYLISEFQLGV